MRCRFVFLLSVVLASCSNPDYQSFRDGSQASEVASQEQWSVPLPYKSGTSVSATPAPDGLWAIDFDKRVLHVTKIPWDAERRPRESVHVLFRRADDFDVVDGEFLLVTERLDVGTSLVTLLDRRDLSTRFSGVLAFNNRFAHKKEESTHVEDKVILQQTVMPFETPQRLACHFHVIDLKTRRATSFVFDDTQLDGVRAVLTASRGFCEFAIDDLFLLDDARLLVFSLSDGKKTKLYYSLDLTAPTATPKRELPRQVESAGQRVAPETFFAEERENESETDAVKISGKAYRFRQVDVLPGATVVIAQEDRPDHPSAAGRPAESLSLMGVRGGSGGFVRLWERPISVSTEDFIADEEGDAVYFADVGSTGIEVAGVRAATGAPLRGFPANFRWRTIGSQRFEVRITGTAIDSRRGLIYLHDLEKNRIVCAKHRF